MSRVLVVVNPTAGGGRAGALWNRLAGAASALAEVMVASTAEPGAARSAIAAAVAGGVDRVVVVGGDGSIHLAINALLDAGCASEVTVGLVPAGTGSDLARVLGLPRQPEAALRRAVVGAGRRFDVGRVEAGGDRRYFCNIASAGVSGVVDTMVNANPRRGRTAFLSSTVRALRAYRCVPMRVVVDGAVLHDGPVFLVAVANGTTFGRGMRIAPRARPDDGLFDIVVVGEVGGWELLRRLPQVYLGLHLAAPQVRSARGREVEVEPRAVLPPFDLDGETYPSGAARFTLLHGALCLAAGKDV